MTTLAPQHRPQYSPCRSPIDWAAYSEPQAPLGDRKDDLSHRGGYTLHAVKEVEIGEPVLAPHMRPRRETSCSQSHAEVKHAARCFAAHAHDDLCPAAATSHSCEAGGDRTGVILTCMPFPCKHACHGGRGSLVAPCAPVARKGSTRAPCHQLCRGRATAAALGAALKEWLLPSH